MKNARLWGISIAVIGVLLCSSAVANVTTFDDVTAASKLYPIPAGYAGFEWVNIGVQKYDRYGGAGSSGYYNGVVSKDHVAFNYADPATGAYTAEFSGDPFKLVNATFTSAWLEGLTIEVEGHLANVLVGTDSFTVNSTAQTLREFNWTVDTVRFESYGGSKEYNYQYDRPQFAMDNLTTSACVPAPGAVLLGSLGAGLVGWMRRRRAL